MRPPAGHPRLICAFTITVPVKTSAVQPVHHIVAPSTRLDLRLYRGSYSHLRLIWAAKPPPSTARISHRSTKTSSLRCRVPPPAAQGRLSTQSKGSTGSYLILACPSCLQRRPQTNRITPQAATAGLSTSATCRSPSFPSLPAASSRSWWTRGIQTRGRPVQVWPHPKPPSTTSKSNKNQETSALSLRFKPASQHSESLQFYFRKTVLGLVLTESP